MSSVDPIPRVVILVEDEVLLRTSLARGLARIEGIEVLQAGTFAEALALFDMVAPSLLVSDIDLPDRTGIEFLGELGQRGLAIPVIFVSAYVKAYKAQIPMHARVEVFEKPVSLEQLREAVRSRVGAQLATSAAPFGLPDYLQLACMGRHSVVITVQGGESGGGQVIVVGGELWSVRDTKGAGTDAFRRLAFGGGSVRCDALSGTPPERNVEARWDAMLMDTARAVDEAARSGGETAHTAGDDEFDLGFDAMGSSGPEGASVPATPPPRTISAEAPAPAAGAKAGVAESSASPTPAGSLGAARPADARFADLWERGVAALLAKDYPLAVQLLVEARALRPGDAQIAVNLKRLKQLGHAVPDVPEST